MMIRETFKVSFDAVLANKMRSLLTMLGIIIGIAAVIAMVALGQGAQNSIQDRLAGLGTNVLTIRPGQGFSGGVDRGSTRLTVEDAEALRDAQTDIAAVSPELESRVQAEYGNANANLSVVGAWPTYFSVNNYEVASGRAFNDAEDRGRRRVAVVGSMVGEKLGLTSSDALLGQTLRIKGVSFEVIGVLQEKGAQGFQNTDENIFIPLGTAQFRLMGTDKVRSISLQTASEQALDGAMAQADQILRRTHKLRPGTQSDFTIRNQASLLSTFQDTARTFSFLLAGIALISLLVGGIGIMNIMLVSVTERTREIGLRKALGAKRRDVMVQFLIEALVLCLGGGAIGLALGMGGSTTLQHVAGWNMAVSPSAVVLAFGFSAAVGIVFGLWPARRAARLEPIEALRYE